MDNYNFEDAFSKIKGGMSNSFEKSNFVSNFYVTKRTIFENLLWLIENGKVRVQWGQSINDSGEFYHLVYEAIINNFVYLSEETVNYNGNHTGGLGDPSLTYRLQANSGDYTYFSVGKFNPITESEDILLFYMDGVEYDLMKLKLIDTFTASSEKGKEFLDKCRENDL